MANTKEKTSLAISNDFTPVEYDTQYILMVNALKKYFPIKDGLIAHTVGYEVGRAHLECELLVDAPAALIVKTLGLNIYRSAFVATSDTQNQSRYKRKDVLHIKAFIVAKV